MEVEFKDELDLVEELDALITLRSRCVCWIYCNKVSPVRPRPMNLAKQSYNLSRFFDDEADFL